MNLMEAASGDVPITSPCTKGRPEPVIGGDLGGEDRVLRQHRTCEQRGLLQKTWPAPVTGGLRGSHRQNHLPGVNGINGCEYIQPGGFTTQSACNRPTDDLGPLISLKLGGIKTTPLPG